MVVDEREPVWGRTKERGRWSINRRQGESVQRMLHALPWNPGVRLFLYRWACRHLDPANRIRSQFSLMKQHLFLRYPPGLHRHCLDPPLRRACRPVSSKRDHNLPAASRQQSPILKEQAITWCTRRSKFIDWQNLEGNYKFSVQHLVARSLLMCLVQLTKNESSSCASCTPLGKCRSRI